MILVDTSAWIEFLRDTGSRVCDRVEELIESEIAVCDPVRMEVLAGARSESHLRSLRGLLARATLLPTAPADYDDASAMYRACRGEGETVRRVIDCLIGSIAVRAGAAVLHNDSDFDVLARYTRLRVVSLD